MSLMNVFTNILTRQRPYQCLQSRLMTTVGAEKPVETSIRKKLTDTFQPSILEVVNESNMHNVPKGSETHFKVLVIASKFESLPLIKRHRMVNEALQEELQSGVHALSIVTKTPAQWETSNQEVGKSPPCMGGSSR